MNVLFASVEMYPLAKVGGLGDVAGSLPKNLRALGIDTRVVMPYHLFINVESQHIASVNIGNDKYEIYETFVENVPVYLVKNTFLSRDKVYGYEDTIRWAKFSQLIPYVPQIIGWDVDIIHINDWMTSLAPLYSLIMGNESPFLLTIHNLKHQGSVSLKASELSIPMIHAQRITHNGMINYMKGGILYSTAVNTVSPTYAKEITTEEYGEGLHEILRENINKLYGILNGIDYNVWNPETDNYIEKNYSVSNIYGKEENREALKKQLRIEDDYPILGFIARLVEQKGIDILSDVLKRIENAHVVILGTGREKYENLLRGIAGKFVHPIIKYDEAMAHKIYAGVDMFLMPSRFEPCGLGQMIAMRYGAVPIVRKTGGLADTVKDIGEGGWGFVFEDYSANALSDAINRAIEYYKNDKWEALIRKVMSLDFSWKKSSEKYAELYQRIA